MEQNSLLEWIYQDEQADVALLYAPFLIPPPPSTALSIFKSALAAEGITSRVLYPSFPFIHLVGPERIREISKYIDTSLDSEFLFAHLTDNPSTSIPEEYVSGRLGDLSEKERISVLQFLKKARSAAEMIVDACARRILHMGAKVVAASCIYSQQTSTLAILRRVKELDPRIKTIMGGYFVNGGMGMAVLRYFPSVDCVSFGEGDETIASVCRTLMDDCGGPMPYGTICRRDPIPETAPYRMTKDMNTVCFPDYQDFFREAQLEAGGLYGEESLYPEGVDPAFKYENIIFLEGSRGCWWGQKHPCTFCGLNGLQNVFREKTPERIHEEIRLAKKLYPHARIQLSDNILSRAVFRELLPALARDEETYDILAEVKANLNQEQVYALHQAGVHRVQPGIESLNDHLLELMGKGVPAVQNVAILKYFRRWGIQAGWNLLTGVPGEKREDYEQMLSLIPLLEHLEPPALTIQIYVDRYSKYAEDPASYGMELEPFVLYRYCYSGDEELIRNMSTRYDVVGGSFLEEKKKNADLYARITTAVEQWQKRFYTERPAGLYMLDQLFGILIQDTRTCAVKELTFLAGLSEKIYRQAFSPVRPETIAQNLPDYSVEQITAGLQELLDKKLMIFVNGRYLSLAVPVK